MCHQTCSASAATCRPHRGTVRQWTPEYALVLVHAQRTSFPAGRKANMEPNALPAQCCLSATMSGTFGSSGSPGGICSRHIQNGQRDIDCRADCAETLSAGSVLLGIQSFISCTQARLHYVGLDVTVVFFALARLRAACCPPSYLPIQLCPLFHTSVCSGRRAGSDTARL